ncbi:MAG TPA: isoleucine--tRNA ligase [Coleofasciculaceae cyanobacterium]|jgi:isoleucyl-tRNA synthetase
MQEPSVQELKPVNYKDTLNLPQTAFKMKAGAATREVEIEQYWDENRIYQQLHDGRNKAHKFVLHDGPPYLSSDKIHIGTALNKILKDFVTRYKSQQGFYTPYVPGYDGHGLPIENAVVKTIKGGRHAISEVELRKRCREFALANLKGQETNFKRLGVWGDWAHPYITIDAAFEATQIKVFGKMYEKGFVYKGLKPVYWCPACETALADAEVEYADHVSHSIYVKFPIASMERNALTNDFKKMLEGASLVIWTTTPWTLPANLALAVNPDLDYHLVTSKWGKLVIAKDLLESFAKVTMSEDEFAEYIVIGSTDTFEAIAEFSGRELEHIAARHPFIDRESPVLLGDHVTLEAGTGVVHTAPGHGMEDYLVVQLYNREQLKDRPIPILSPLDNSGKFIEEAGVPELQGVFYEKGNAIVLDILREKGALIYDSKFSHSYPHCWRCQNPVIYRATDQWFIDINQFRTEALSAIDTVEWLPERGRNRIFSMVEGRGDWCLSRQRVWGVPIPVFYYADTREVLITPEIIEHLHQLFQQHSSDIWWAQSAEELLAGLPDALKQQYGIGQRPLEKEMDIMDVWFDSGITHTAVVEARAEELGHLPVEMYLEGSDQHRGWFQSSLLTSVMLYGRAPYKSVLTHGFVLDEQGRKMSKSLGNVVDPNSVIREYGADVLRLWVASVDYTNDARIGQNKLREMAEIYKKVRNTLRFVLGNLYDFDPSKDTVPYEQLSALDRYTLHRLHHILGNITNAFESYKYHLYSHEIQYLCMTDLSQLYFDVTKDILYCDAPNAPRRRAVQTVLYEILSTVLPVLVPVTPHLAEDIWLSLPEHQRMQVNGAVPPSAVMLPWPQVKPDYLNPELVHDFETLLAVKEAVNQALEVPRSEGHIGSSLEARVQVMPQEAATQQSLQKPGPAELAVLFITSGVELVATPPDPDSSKWHTEAAGGGAVVYAAQATGSKCTRCWRFEPTVGQMPDHPEICARCAEALQSAKA